MTIEEKLVYYTEQLEQAKKSRCKSDINTFTKMIQIYTIKLENERSKNNKRTD